MIDAIGALIAAALLLAICWTPIFLVLHFAKKYSTSRRFIALTVADRANRADMALGGGPSPHDDASNGLNYDHHDYEFYSDTEGGNGE